MEKQVSDTKTTLRSHHSIGKDKLRKYLSDILSIDIDEEYLEKKTNRFINDISHLNKKPIIKCNNKPISNIPE